MLSRAYYVMQCRQLPLEEKTQHITQNNILKIPKSSFQSGLWSKPTIQQFWGFLVFQCRIYVLLPFSNPATWSILDRPLASSGSDGIASLSTITGIGRGFLTSPWNASVTLLSSFKCRMDVWGSGGVFGSQQSCDTSRTEQMWHLQLKCHHNCQTWVNISGKQIFLQIKTKVSFPAGVS